MTRRRTDNPLRLAAAALIVGAAAVALADEATLRDGVRVSGEQVTLGQIATLEGDYAERWATVTVGRFDPAQTRLRLSRAEVRDRLTEAGVHWGRLSLRGDQSIDLVRAGAAVAATAVTPATEAVRVTETKIEGEAAPLRAAANPLAAVVEPAAGERTIRQAVADWIVAANAVPAEDLRIVCHDETDAAWSVRQGAGRLEIEPQAVNTIGRIPFTVRRYDGDALAETEHVRVEVSIRRPVLVVARSVSRGQTITDGDVKREVRWLDSLNPQPVAPDVDAVVGQQADQPLRPGRVLRDGDVVAPELIKRGELITVRAISGGLVIRLVARAGEDGTLNQLIEARNTKTREVFQVRVVGPREAVMLVDGRDLALPGGQP